MDDNKDGKVNFTEFTAYNRKFPSILFPAFNMQMKLRTKVLGVPFWEAKTIQMAALRAQKGITVKTVLDDIENKVVEERRAAQRAIKATTKPTVVAKKTPKRKAEDSKIKSDKRKTKKSALPPNHQYSQPEKITVGSKKTKKAKAKTARAELVDNEKDDDDYTLSTIGRILSPFSAKLKKKKERERERNRKKKMSSYGEDEDEENNAPKFTSNATVKTEIINFNVVNGDFVLRGSNMEKDAKKKQSKQALRPSSTDIRDVQRDMARKELDKKVSMDTKRVTLTARWHDSLLSSHFALPPPEVQEKFKGDNSWPALRQNKEVRQGERGSNL
jgi:hypothetical protein